MDRSRENLSAVHTMRHSSITGFCDWLKAAGRKESTIETYRKKLMELYKFLSPDEGLDSKSLKSWIAYLSEQYNSANSVNVCISVVNMYLDYVGRRDLQLRRLSAETQNSTGELTRVDYLRLLQGAKRQGRERLYLAIKVFAILGLMPAELEMLTVENVDAGHVPGSENGEYRYFPRCLRTELLEYCRKQGISRGQVFRTRSGNDLNNSNLIKEMKNLCDDVGVHRDKGSPRALKKLYNATQSQINSEVRRMVEANYEHLLETEQSIYGWELRNNH